MEIVVTTGATRRAKRQSYCRHQQTNTQPFTDRMLFLSPNQQCQSTEGKWTAVVINNQEVLRERLPDKMNKRQDCRMR